MNGEVSIIKLFCRDLSRELTIRQVSKLIKKSYAYTNKEVWDLVKKGVLNKKEIGKSVVCSLNLKNEMTKVLLSLNSALEKQEHLKDKEELIKELKEKDAYTAFISNKKLIIISKEKISVKNAKILDKKEFASFIKENQDNLIVYGFEKYWELVGDAYE